MHQSSVRPVFVVGSPRSGTSILTWCLGQHPNILPLEEGNWLDKFAYELGCTYESGSKRGDRSQLGSLGISCDEFYLTFGQAINNLILNSRRRYFNHADQVARLDPIQVHPAFKLGRDDAHPKARWVDGTPEYSLCTYGLLKLFPEARFIHIVRDVRAVVRSLVRFSAMVGMTACTEREAFEYWLSTTRACVLSEEALGPGVIRRLRYVDLVENPAPSLKKLFDFLDESFCAESLEPLAKRINSSRVPPDFDSYDGTTPDSLIAEVEALSETLQNEQPAATPSQDAREKLESRFWEHARYIGSLDGEVEALRRRVTYLEKKLLQRTEWAQSLDKVVAERDRTVRELQEELKRRTITNGLRKLGRILSNRLGGPQRSDSAKGL